MQKAIVLNDVTFQQLPVLLKERVVSGSVASRGRFPVNSFTISTLPTGKSAGTFPCSTDASDRKCQDSDAGFQKSGDLRVNHALWVLAFVQERIQMKASIEFKVKVSLFVKW